MDFSLQIDPTNSAYGDLLILGNDLVLTSDANPSGTNPVLQDILQRLRFFLGEWFLDNTQGLPWFQSILVKNPKQSDVDAILRNAITGTPGVNQLSTWSFTVNRATRVLSVSFSAITTAGKVNYTGVLSPIGGLI